MYRIAICDNDKEICDNARNEILQYAREHQKMIEISVFIGSEDLLNTLENANYFNLIFLDVKLQPIRGGQVALMIRDIYKDYLAHIVFISCYPPAEKTLFESAPFSYLVKPFNENDVINVLERSIAVNERKGLFTFKIKGVYSRVYYDQVLYVESNSRKLKLVTLVKKYEYYGKFEEIKARFLKEGFVMIHHSISVNPVYVNSYFKDHIILLNDEQLGISRSYQKMVKEFAKSEYKDK